MDSSYRAEQGGVRFAGQADLRRIDDHVLKVGDLPDIEFEGLRGRSALVVLSLGGSLAGQPSCCRQNSAAGQAHIEGGVAQVSLSNTLYLIPRLSEAGNSDVPHLGLKAILSGHAELNPFGDKVLSMFSGAMRELNVVEAICPQSRRESVEKLNLGEGDQVVGDDVVEQRTAAAFVQ
ncbi:MAG TPA: hypothetical protein VNG12_08585 [Acidimicrobiales bacterium]|nr:hypothetical protein [Acidimicrobiales bacterium]